MLCDSRKGKVTHEGCGKGWDEDYLDATWVMEMGSGREEGEEEGGGNGREGKGNEV